LTECSKTRSDDCSDVSTHGDICVSVDSKVSNCSYRKHTYLTSLTMKTRMHMVRH